MTSLPTTTPRRVAIVGSRGFQPLSKVVAYVESLPLDTVIVSGGARGVDQTAAAAARKRGMNVVEYLPDFTRYPGHVAPLMRNKQIVDNCDELTAFWDGSSTGTQHSLTLALARGVKHTVFL